MDELSRKRRERQILEELDPDGVILALVDIAASAQIRYNLALDQLRVAISQRAEVLLNELTEDVGPARGLATAALAHPLVVEGFVEAMAQGLIEEAVHELETFVVLCEDGKPPGREHMRLVEKADNGEFDHLVPDGGDVLTPLNEALAKCERPAMAIWQSDGMGGDFSG